MDKNLAKLTLDLGWMTFEQIKLCVEDGRKNPGSSLAHTMEKKGFLSQSQISQLVAILENAPVNCPSCHQSYRAGELASPKNFQCPSCQVSLQTDLAFSSAVLSQNSNQRASSEGTHKEIPPSSYASGMMENDQTHISDRLPRQSAPSGGLEIGTVLDNHLEIQKLLGQGGMGAVYLAYDHTLKRPLALKVIASAVGNSLDAMVRFEREAQTAAQLNHPNIVQVYGLSSGGDPKYMMMEYVEGYSLKDLIDQKGSLPFDRGLSIIGQVAEGLKLAHDKNILHRDIKPDNIFLSNQREVKLGDFGLAKDVNASMLTQTGSIMGTPHYMSPEQAQGKDLDGSADMYSLGATLYHALIGKPPFRGEDPMSVLFKHINEPLGFPKDLKIPLPSPLRNLIRKMMAKEKWRRPQTMGELIGLIEQTQKALEGKEENSLSVPPSEVSNNGIPTKKIRPLVRPPKRKFPMVGVAMALLILLGLGGVILYAVQNSSTPPAPPKKIALKNKPPLIVPKLDKEPEKIPEFEKKYLSWEEKNQVLQLRRRKRYLKALKMIATCIKTYPKNAWLKDEEKSILKLKVRELKFIKEYKTALALVTRYRKNNPKDQWFKKEKKKLKGLIYAQMLEKKYASTDGLPPAGTRYKAYLSRKAKRDIRHLILAKEYLPALNLIGYYLKKYPNNKWLQRKEDAVEDLSKISATPPKTQTTPDPPKQPKTNPNPPTIPKRRPPGSPRHRPRPPRRRTR